MAIVNSIILIFIGRNKIKENRSTLHEKSGIKNTRVKCVRLQ